MPRYIVLYYATLNHNKRKHDDVNTCTMCNQHYIQQHTHIILYILLLYEYNMTLASGNWDVLPHTIVCFDGQGDVHRKYTIR